MPILKLAPQASKNSFRTDLVFATIAVIAALSLGLFAFAVLVERLVVPWARDQRSVEQSF